MPTNMRSDEFKLVALRKRERELQDEVHDKRACKKSARSWDETDKLDAPNILEDLEYVNVEQTLQDVDEERVRDLMRELMEEIGMVESDIQLPHHHRHDQCGAAASGLSDFTANFISDSATSSASCSSKFTDAHCSSAEYSGNLVLTETDIQFSANIEPALAFDDRHRRACRLMAKDDAGASTSGSPDDLGVSTSSQNSLQSASTSSSYNNSDYNWLQNVFFGPDDMCCHADDEAADLQMFPWEEEAKQWCFTCEDDEISDWIITAPNSSSDSDRQMKIAGGDAEADRRTN